MVGQAKFCWVGFYCVVLDLVGSSWVGFGGVGIDWGRLGCFRLN